MFKPYKEIESNEEFTIYEFKTVYLWTLYLIFAMLVFTYFTGSRILMLVGIASIFLYFALVSSQYMVLNRKMKKAAREATVEISGSKWSFQNPLRVKISNKIT